MPRSRNRDLEAGFATASRPRAQVSLRIALGWMLSVILAPASTSYAQMAETTSGAQPTAPANSQDTATSPAASRVTSPSEAEVATLQAETAGQLQAIDVSASSAATAATGSRAGTPPPSNGGAAPQPESIADKQLREILQERLLLLKEYEKASIEFKKASHPEPTPDQQVADGKAELARLQALLAQSATHPEVLLPTARGQATGGLQVPDAEMKDALEAATNDLKDCKAKLEALRTEVANWEGQQNTRRAERDTLFQTVAALKARRPERDESAALATATAMTRRLAHERQVNADWKSRLEAMRLHSIEAQIALEAKLAGVREQGVQVCQAQVQIAQRTLELMQGRYREAAERQERKLKEKAADEENTARRSEDPLERFRARRRAELLDLEAQVVKHEQALATNPAPSLDEQRSLADHAAWDFARIKDLLDDGRISRLDAIRLNNDFRRIGPERERLLRNEMAIAEARLQYYEDLLTSVELDLLQDSLHDRYEQDLLRERLPPSRWAQGEAVLAELEQSHREMLKRRRTALERLTECTAQTLDQVARRLAILDEEYGFIRTHIFWVRDQDPIGPGTITQGAREFQGLAKGLLRMAQESARRRHWGRASAEFVTAALAALGLPIGLIRLRRMLRTRIERDLPPADGAKAS